MSLYPFALLSAWTALTLNKLSDTTMDNNRNYDKIVPLWSCNRWNVEPPHDTLTEYAVIAHAIFESLRSQDFNCLIYAEDHKKCDDLLKLVEIILPSGIREIIKSDIGSSIRLENNSKIRICNAKIWNRRWGANNTYILNLTQLPDYWSILETAVSVAGATLSSKLLVTGISPELVEKYRKGIVELVPSV